MSESCVPRVGGLDSSHQYTLSTIVTALQLRWLTAGSQVDLSQVCKHVRALTMKAHGSSSLCAASLDEKYSVPGRVVLDRAAGKLDIMLTLWH
eukprot:16117756-Heterocapsa_arctica.AAC.1